ncbi:transmembrane transport protein [Salmonella enterica subsp. arizonae]|uniref:Transmembrane transport protein n=1 Tax=Salmonella enterica subsp. arizonae TaxID=59203 RepID=A0A379RY94_SALER|nr:transmembrane transport protein [Salmonella enterica subsp. arizonae]
MTKPTHGLSPALIVLMSVATGLAVASNYYAQPLLDTIAHHFSLSASSAGFIVTAAQLGYAAGLLFLVPLGDMFERRTLIVSMTLLAAGGMLITASSQSLSMMILGTALTGLFSVVAQILVPLAATLATPDTRGKVVGTIMSGLLLGILLARTGRRTAGKPRGLAHCILASVGADGADGRRVVARAAKAQIRHSS